MRVYGGGDLESPIPDHGVHSAEETWLGEQLHILKRQYRLILTVFFSSLVAVMVWSLLTRPVYQAAVRILIERENPKVLTFKDVTEVDAGRDDYYQTQYKLLQNRSLIRALLLEINLFQEPEFGGPSTEQAVAAARSAPSGVSRLMEDTVDAVLRKVSVVPEKNTRLVGLRFESSNPELAAQVANTLANLYISQTQDVRYQASSEAGRWLAGQIEEQRRKVEELEQGQQALKQKDGILNIDERRSLLEQRLKELGSAATSLKTARLQREAVYQQMRSVADSEELPEVMRNPVVQALRIELATLGRQEAELAEKYLDQHPQLVQVRKQIDDMKARLKAEARRVVQAAETEFRTAQEQERSVLAAIEAVKDEAADLALRSGEYDTRKRELDAAKAVLDSLLARAKETDVTRELRSSNIRIVDPATVPRRPIRPDRFQDLLLGMVLGLGLGVGLAMLLDHLDSSIKTSDDVHRHLSVPLLAVIPEADKASSQNGLILNLGSEAPVDHFFEAYRVLRTALQYSWPERRPRVLLVTSTIPGEGKTLTSLNLARSLAAGGGRVLIVDCDLRKPQIHALLRGSRTPGLSDVLVGNAKPAVAIRNEAGTTFDFMPAGSEVPSPADLISGETVAHLTEWLRTEYDWVLFDTPPVGLVADPLILSPHADGVVLVVGAESVHRAAVRETIRRLARSGVRVLGTTLNRAKHESHSYYYSSYYRSYSQPRSERSEATTAP